MRRLPLLWVGVLAAIFVVGVLWIGYSSRNRSQGLTSPGERPAPAVSASRPGETASGVTRETSAIDPCSSKDESAQNGLAGSLRDVLESAGLREMIGSESDRFSRWEHASYAPIIADALEDLLDAIPVTLDDEIEEAEYDELRRRVKELLLLYNSQDADRYIAFFSKGGGVPIPERVERCRKRLQESSAHVDPSTLEDPVSVYREDYRALYADGQQNAWESLATELSRIRIYRAWAEETLYDAMHALPNKGVVSTHLRWQYPRSTADIVASESHVKYALVELQIKHANSDEKFPLTFLFYWNADAGTWHLKAGYARFSQNAENRILM